MNPAIHILGVPNFANYEAAAALIKVPRDGGQIEYVTIGEERLARVKHAYTFPLRGIHYCLEAFGLESLDQIDYIYTDYARLPRWLNSGPGYRKLEHDYLKLRLNYPRHRIRVVDHHDAHAACAFYPSPFQDAAVLVVDALGSRLNTQTLYHFTEAGVRVLERGDHWGIGRLYSLVTGSILPYGPEKGFGKTMGLAPYGRRQPGPVLEFQARDAGMSSDYSAFATRAPLPRIIAKGVRLCEDREQVLEPYFSRAAYDVQQECERQMVRMARYAHERTGARNLCVTGGVALNGLANARILQAGVFEDVWIPPGCSDTGLPLGLALWGYFQHLAEPRVSRVSVTMSTAYVGRPYPVSGITAQLEHYGIEYAAASPEAIAALLAEGKVIGWYEGGSEFGPRALGHRSIIADPRRPDMKDTLNKRVKFREPYRPYAPSILEEYAAEWLVLDRPSPFMLLVVEVREDKRALVPAITHVDHTTRPQTVTEAANPNYYRLLKEFHRLTGVPMVLNTSLNVNREPIVETPVDALICAFGTAIDGLYLEGLWIDCRRDPNPSLLNQLKADRTRMLEDQWAAITTTYLTGYDTGERDRYLAEENRIAEWHRDYRSKYELERQISQWRDRQAAIVIVGTRGHTRCLQLYFEGFSELKVSAFVPLDDEPGERGEFTAYREATLGSLDWRNVDAVLISTHEYQARVASQLREVAPSGLEIFAMYDDAGDSLLHVLPGKWPIITPIRERHPAAAVRAPRSATDVESSPEPTGIGERYALIVSYRYCHPPQSFLNGMPAISPEELDRHLRVLKQNFVCTTVGELMNPDAPLPEVVAVVTFDDGLKDVLDYALPVLQRWQIPATVYCWSVPLLERRMLNVHRGHLLQAKLGTGRFDEEFRRALASDGPASVDAETVELADFYRDPHGAGPRVTTPPNFEQAHARLDVVFRQLFERFIGEEQEFAARLYLAPDEVRRCQDAGLEIGVHGHQDLVLSLLGEDQQRRELQAAADYFRRALRLRTLHYSYPHGAWNAVTERLLPETGYSSAVTRIAAIVKPADLSRHFRLPRFDAREVFAASGDLIADRLHALFVGD